MDTWDVKLSIIFFFQFPCWTKEAVTIQEVDNRLAEELHLRKKKIICLPFSMFRMNLCMDDSKRNLWSLLPWRQPKGWKEFNTDFHWAAKQLFVRETVSLSKQKRKGTQTHATYFPNLSASLLEKSRQHPKELILSVMHRHIFPSIAASFRISVHSRC